MLRYLKKYFIILAISAIIITGLVVLTPKTKISSHQKGSGYNLIFISIDTLRADRLTPYGYKRNTSPEIQKFSESSVVFEDTISVSSWTLPTHMTFFTGLFPHVHGVDYPGDIQANKDTKLLAELLQQSGYRNFAYTGGGYVHARYGFNRGFEKYRMNHRNKYRNQGYDLTPSLEELKNDLSKLSTDENFFVFLHTLDIHCPYIPPKQFINTFQTAGAEPINLMQCEHNLMKQNVTPAQVSYLSDRYDEGVSWADSNIGDLIRFLQTKSLLEKTIIILTSDHGEEFQEHGKIGHTAGLHRELLQIPLIIYVPGVAAGRIKSQVSSVDIFDTITDLLGIEHNIKTNGQSLWPIIKSKNETEYTPKFQFSEKSTVDIRPLFESHINNKGHLINNLRTTEVQFYDLINDPTEQQDISPTENTEIQQRLSEINSLKKATTPIKAEQAKSPDKKDVEHLKSMGYF